MLRMLDEIGDVSNIDKLIERPGTRTIRSS
ncbi:hypothetical protein ACPA9J_07255 [Pseudomonas aeruginosa]